MADLDDNIDTSQLPPRPPLKDDLFYIYSLGGSKEVWRHVFSLGPKDVEYLFSKEWKNIAPKDWEEPSDLMDILFEDQQIRTEMIEVLLLHGYLLSSKHIDKTYEHERQLESRDYYAGVRKFIEKKL